MAPTIRSQRALRVNRNQPDTDVLSGMPVRQYVEQSVTVNSAPPKPVRGGPKKDTIWTELPMPKGSELYPPHSTLLLRQARMPYIPPEDRDDPEEGDDDADGEADDAFTIKKWVQVPQGQERPEVKLLADRPRSLATLYGGAPGAAVMRKVKVKKISSEGSESFFDVLVPEGIKLEGEVAPSEAPAIPTQPVAPGTVVEGVGVANAQGVVIAEAVTPTANRRKPPPPKRKKQHGPGRGRKKMMLAETMGADGAMEMTEAATPSRNGDYGDEDDDDDGDDDGREDGELSDGTGTSTPDPRGPPLLEPPRSVPTDIPPPSLVPPVVVVVEADQQSSQAPVPSTAPLSEAMDIDTAPTTSGETQQETPAPIVAEKPNEPPADFSAMEITQEGNKDPVSTPQLPPAPEVARDPTPPVTLPPDMALPVVAPPSTSAEQTSEGSREARRTSISNESHVDRIPTPVISVNDASAPAPVSAPVPVPIPGPDPAASTAAIDIMITEPSHTEPPRPPTESEPHEPESIMDPAPDAPVTQIAAILDAPAVPVEGDVVSEAAPTVDTNESKPSLPENTAVPNDVDMEPRPEDPVPTNVTMVEPPQPLPEVQVGESAANIPDDDLKLEEPRPADAATAVEPVVEPAMVGPAETEPPAAEPTVAEPMVAELTDKVEPIVQERSIPEVTDAPQAELVEPSISQPEPSITDSATVAESDEAKPAVLDAPDAPVLNAPSSDVTVVDTPALTTSMPEASIPEVLAAEVPTAEVPTAEVPVTEVPEMPEAPEKQEELAAPKAPEAPEAPEALAAPMVQEAPKVSVTPEASEVPERVATPVDDKKGADGSSGDILGSLEQSLG